ncbi:MAG: ATP-binding protein [Clostridiales bacterium]|nr:ATP-binding protein [Clostridiales bacterium]
MKKKINFRLIAISVVAVIATMICVTFVFYGLFQKQVKNDLRVNAGILKATGLFVQENTETGGSDDAETASANDGQDNDGADANADTDADADSEANADADNSGGLAELEAVFGEDKSLRITWVSPEGEVLYDNDADAAELENHSDRPEIADAMATGEGESVRNSDTMNMTTVYYAVLLDDGSVLRLAADVRSIFSVFMTVFPVIILVVAIIIVCCILVSHLLTRKLLAPIDQMAENIGDAARAPVYKELVPFVNTIRQQHENILSAARSRQDFTANVSHELKTPLTAISGYAELIENHMVDEEQETRFAEQIRQNADRLLTLINDIIRLSELDSGEDERFLFEPMDLYETAQGMMELLKLNAARRNISLTLQGEPCMMRGCKSMITELIDNLCQNAIRYNNEGGRVEVRVYKENDHPVLTVSDTGIGIPKDMQERVFERFFRVDKSRSKETGGTGLGLAIVKHIVELHDADIFLESEIGRGTEITVKF